MYHIMGFDNGRLILLTTQVFSDFSEAVKYKESVAKAWKAYIVKTVDNQD